MESPSTGNARRAVRLMLPALLILVWLIAAAVGGPYFGRVDEVSSNDNTTYLPDSAEATQVQDRLPEFLDAEAVPAVVVVSADEDLTESDIATVSATVENLAQHDGVDNGVSPAIPSSDGQAIQAFVPVNSHSDLSEVVAEIRGELDTELPDELTAHVTGPAGFSADLVEAFAGIDSLLLAVALTAVFVILLVVYRSLLLPVMVLTTSMIALCVALLTVWWLAKADVLILTGQTQGILFILVIGAATDYALLYTARYREELRRHRHPSAATWAAIKGAVEPILASGGTVIAGLLCLLLSDLGSNRSLGPVATIGILFAMAAALSLLPALLVLFGRAAYWPRRPIFDPDRGGDTVATSGGYARIAAAIARRPRTVWISCTVILLVGAAFVPQLRADGVPESDLVLTTSDARQGQDELAAHFPAGSGTPTYVTAPEEQYQRIAERVVGADGVDSVALTVPDAPSGTVPLSKRGEAERPGETPQPAVDDGQVLLQATLADEADSVAAEETVRDLRGELGNTVQIGGTTATAIDTNDTAAQDRDLIIPVVLLVILLILMLLLRAIVAPILLIVTTVLSFGTAMGVAALVFNDVIGFVGADPSVPLYGFVFLVALGIDYNIFLMTRVREEALRHGNAQGIHRGLAVTGGVITSAGIVLATTFTALAVIPVLFLVQLAFIVAFGVLLDTFLVRTLLVPALGLDIGRTMWWPSRAIGR